MINKNREDYGFTLTEILIAMAIASIVLGSIYSLFSTHQKELAIQEQLAEAQQNARAALQFISRDVVMAGYSTTPGTGILFANRTSLTVSYANQGVKTFSFSRYSGARIGRRVGGERQAVADKIRRLYFSYLDIDGNPLGPDGSGNVTPAVVKQVQISITAGTPRFGSYSTGCTLMTIVTPRNL